MSYGSATVGSAGRGTTTSQAVSMSNVPAGALLIVSVVLWNSGGAPTFPATLTDNQGNTLTRRTSTNLTVGSFIGMAQYDALIPSLAASWSVTVTQTGASSSFQWDVVPLYYATGAPASSEFAQSSSNTATATSVSTTTSAGGANTELAIADATSFSSSSSVYSSATLAAGSFLYRQNDNLSLQVHAIAEINSTSLHSAGVTQTVSNIATNDSQGIEQCTYNTAAGGGGTVYPNLRLMMGIGS